MNQFAGFSESSAGAGARTPARKRNDLRESQKCSPGRATGAQRSNESTRGGAEGVGPDYFSFLTESKRSGERLPKAAQRVNAVNQFAGFSESSAGAGARTLARKRNDLRESQKCSPGRATEAQRRTTLAASPARVRRSRINEQNSQNRWFIPLSL